ncbi:MAG: ribonuclease PH [Spirochaetae bacterium HGW-Spirochaetae-1]|nr:MAG: ribonuclease PH [Spirochaetae bacterium HGW-Spirochaetae-1]
MKRKSRNSSEMRSIRVTPDFAGSSFGSVLFEMGETKIICAASVSTDVPDHAKNKGNGWLTAEYSLLPYSTSPRTKRELLKRDGRSVEIQRLIGRSLRCAVDLAMMQNYSIAIDCDVLKADGGTRTAAITGGYIALEQAVSRMIKEGMIEQSPIIENVAAISVGMVEGEMLLDLDFYEDSRADVDMNIVMNGSFDIIEIQGTGEKKTFSIGQMNEMVALAGNGILKLVEIQNSI